MTEAQKNAKDEEYIDSLKDEISYLREILASKLFEEDNLMFIGDFIFKESIGRVDLPGGNSSEMNDSIKKILEYDNSIKLYPGHNDSTTLGYEKENNPYLK